jgi:Ca2+:H+ antiporter
VKLRIHPLDWLLVFVPATIAVHLAWPAAETVSFLLSAVAVIPLAGLMGRATEAVAARVGTALGGLLSAAFGNAAELILALSALRAGELEVVKASLTGSIIGNILLVLGAAIVAGGARRERQRFNLTAAGAGNATLYLATAALVLPTLLHHGADPHPETRIPTSLAISLVLLALYFLSLLFSLRTHAHLYETEAEAARPAHGSLRKAVLVLLGATAAVAVVAEILVASLEGAAHTLGFSRVFVGVIVVAVVGNAAEHSTAVLMALRDKMDLAIQIAVESSKQIALFVAPVLVVAGLLVGQPMDLVFTPLEVVAVGLATGAITLVTIEGESNWLEGAMLIALYAVLGVGFFYVGD